MSTFRGRTADGNYGEIRRLLDKLRTVHRSALDENDLSGYVEDQLRRLSTWEQDIAGPKNELQLDLIIDERLRQTVRKVVGNALECAERLYTLFDNGSNHGYAQN
jgi:hypothetical protein